MDCVVPYNLPLPELQIFTVSHFKKGLCDRGPSVIQIDASYGIQHAASNLLSTEKPMPASLITSYRTQLLLQHVQVICIGCGHSSDPVSYKEMYIFISVSSTISSTAYRLIGQLTELQHRCTRIKPRCEMKTLPALTMPNSSAACFMRNHPYNTMHNY